MSLIKPGTYEVQVGDRPVEVVKVSRVAKRRHFGSGRYVYYRLMDPADVPGGLRLRSGGANCRTEKGFLEIVQRAEATRRDEEGLDEGAAERAEKAAERVLDEEDARPETGSAVVRRFYRRRVETVEEERDRYRTALSRIADREHRGGPEADLYEIARVALGRSEGEPC